MRGKRTSTESAQKAGRNQVSICAGQLGIMNRGALPLGQTTQVGPMLLRLHSLPSPGLLGADFEAAEIVFWNLDTHFCSNAIESNSYWREYYR